MMYNSPQQTGAIFKMMYEEKIEQLSSENQSLKAELALFQARCEHYAEAYDSLKEQIMELRRHRFGTRSERYIDPENPQLSLFENNQNVSQGNFWPALNK